MTSFRIALVQPITVPPPDDEANVAAAVEWIGRAASQGADFVVFPESYPGPWRMPAAYEPHTRIAEAAINRDYPIMFATLYVFTLIGLLLKLVSDLTYMLIDPRIDFAARRV